MSEPTDLDRELLRARVAHALDKLSNLFTPGMKLTFVARHPTAPGRHVIVTEDDVPALADLLATEAASVARHADARHSAIRHENVGPSDDRPTAAPDGNSQAG
jgi:hypothetical protein